MKSYKNKPDITDNGLREQTLAVISRRCLVLSLGKEFDASLGAHIRAPRKARLRSTFYYLPRDAHGTG